MGLYVSYRHALGVQCQYLFLYARDIPLALLHDCWLELALPVARYFQFQFTILRTHAFLRVSIAAIAACLRVAPVFRAAQFRIQLRLHHLLQSVREHLFEHVLHILRRHQLLFLISSRICSLLNSPILHHLSLFYLSFFGKAKAHFILQTPVMRTTVFICRYISCGLSVDAYVSSRYT